MKIFLPVDGSDYTRRALEFLASHIQWSGPECEMVAFTALGALPPHVLHYVDGQAAHDYFADAAKTILGPVEAFAKEQGWRMRVRQAIGSTAQTIAECIEEEKPDLIVMGTHGHGALATMFLGSVAQGVMARCHRPMLLIP